MTVLYLIVPHLSDSWYVCMVCDVAVCLQCVSQRETGTHGTQDFLHVAVAQLGLWAWTRSQQLHGAGDQSDLTCTEHGFIHLQHTHTHHQQNLLVFMQTYRMSIHRQHNIYTANKKPIFKAKQHRPVGGLVLVSWKYKYQLLYSRTFCTVILLCFEYSCVE